MKKIFSLCFTSLMAMVLLTSCLETDGDLAVKYYPYAALRSVSISDIDTEHIVKGADGKDSTVIKTVRGANYPFTINQETGEAYNVDSLPIGTDVTKVSTKISCDGVAHLYVDSLQSFELFVESDSFDYTKPLRLLITSTDGTYAREYKLSLNVHTVDPNHLYWNRIAENPVTSSTAVRMLLKDDKLHLFGCDADGSLSLFTILVSNSVSCETKEVTGLPQSPNMNSLVNYGEKFYITVDGRIYSSEDGAAWQNVPCKGNVKTLFAASDKDNVIWAVANDSVAYANDVAAGFTTIQPLSKNFPLYDLSSVISPLRTNLNINRYLLFGRAAQGLQAQPQLWGKLSNEKKWVNYNLSSYNTKLCPSLESLVVFPYDGKLYAIGGKGTVADAQVEALSAMYVSIDNGLTWEESDKDDFSLPAEVAGIDAPFTAFVDDNGNIWLVVCGENGAIWRGRMHKFDL
ncbi:MAG: hypothetical protein IIV19_07315 [Bacteroidaceae bacterium]|nr:hypothetical protein [Bacteroidaceae bacterium]